jgi:hypothetical protein
MAHFLDASQLVEACEKLELNAQASLIIAACDVAALALAGKLGIEMVDAADNAPGMGGLCVGFGPSHAKQLCPDAILEFDDCSDWHDETEAAKEHAAHVHDALNDAKGG